MSQVMQFQGKLCTSETLGEVVAMLATTLIDGDGELSVVRALAVKIKALKAWMLRVLVIMLLPQGCYFFLSKS
jgi:hypothetical protein